MGNRTPILDPKTTTGYTCSEVIKIKHIIEKPEYRIKDATENIQQMEEIFVPDLEHIIESTKADEEASNNIQVVMKKKRHDIPNESYAKKKDLST